MRKLEIGVNITYIDQPQDLQQVINEMSNENLIAVDTETGGLDPHLTDLSLMQLKAKNTIYILDILALNKTSELEELLDIIFNPTRILIAHRAVFEYCFFRKAFNRRVSNLHCTQQLSKLIGNATGSKVSQVMGHGYKDLCRDLLDIEVDKTQQKSNWLERPLSLEQLYYAAEDVEHLHPLYEILKTTICQPIPAGLGMEFDFHLEMEIIEPLAEMNYVGVPASKITFNKLQKNANSRVNELAKRIAKILELPLDVKLVKGQIVVAFSPASVTLLRHSGNLIKRIEQKTNIKLPDSKAETVKNFLTKYAEKQSSEELLEPVELLNEDENSEFEENEEEKEISSWGIEVLKDILEFKKLMKFESIKYTDYINIHGCICSTIDSNRAATGRMGSSKPNAQNIDSRTSFVIQVDSEEPYISVCSSQTLEKLLRSK